MVWNERARKLFAHSLNISYIKLFSISFSFPFATFHLFIAFVFLIFFFCFCTYDFSYFSNHTKLLAFFCAPFINTSSMKPLHFGETKHPHLRRML